MARSMDDRMEVASRVMMTQRDIPQNISEAKYEAMLVLRAAFPELFADPPTGWIAPCDPTAEMLGQACGITDFVMPSVFAQTKGELIAEMRLAYHAMRNAHLNRSGE